MLSDQNNYHENMTKFVLENYYYYLINQVDMCCISLNQTLRSNLNKITFNKNGLSIFYGKKIEKKNEINKIKY